MDNSNWVPPQNPSGGMEGPAGATQLPPMPLPPVAEVGCGPPTEIVNMYALFQQPERDRLFYLELQMQWLGLHYAFLNDMLTAHDKEATQRAIDNAERALRTAMYDREDTNKERFRTMTRQLKAKRDWELEALDRAAGLWKAP